jgi:hypothetical protein
MAYPSSKTIACYLKATEQLGSGLPLFLHAGSKPVGYINCFIPGPATTAGWPNQTTERWADVTHTTWADWLTKHTSGTKVSTINMSISGVLAVQSISNIPLYIAASGVGDIENSLTCYLQTPNAVSGSTNMFLKVDGVPSGTMRFYVSGTTAPAASGIVNNSIDLVTYTNRRGRSTGTLPMYITESATGTKTGSLNFYTYGTTQTTGTINAYLHNQVVSGGRNMFIKGYWSQFNVAGTKVYSQSSFNPLIETAIPFDSRYNIANKQSRDGAKPATGTLPLFLLHSGVGAGGSLTMHTTSYSTLNSGINAYTSGSQASTGTITMAMPFASGLSTGSIEMTLVGYTLGV